MTTRVLGSVSDDSAAEAAEIDVADALGRLREGRRLGRMGGVLQDEDLVLDERAAILGFVPLTHRVLEFLQDIVKLGDLHWPWQGDQNPFTCTTQHPNELERGEL
eukprot:CAMPEP_0115742476 /NCGR_PEP_ID=MMETSP0272-20121206/90549_1 /TAXON_ID=71861 /ORGANISM="Scrippsiella trochoidea, Strain CCMP3099" /LENGTH=104 /DNA_ID=CAMNT_0003187203 /DNA_START=31 /DNA_END=344 /DNA_ORIENTATION=-